jgi:hypothetical protein
LLDGRAGDRRGQVRPLARQRDHLGFNLGELATHQRAVLGHHHDLGALGNVLDGLGARASGYQGERRNARHYQ